MNPSQISFGIAFAAGLVSFLSPCMLPLVPIYLAQLAGRSLPETIGKQQAHPARFTTFFHAAMFVFGFTCAFVALGATASALGGFLRLYQFQLRQIGGVLLIFMGLHLTGILKLSFLYRQLRFTFLPTRPTYSASLLIGVIFAIGWTPCISIFLGSILGLAASSTTLRQGVLLLLFYSLGMGLPFLLLGLGLDQMSKLLKWLKPHLGKIEVGSGVIMILVGIMIFFNLLAYLNGYFTSFIRL